MIASRSSEGKIRLAPIFRLCRLKNWIVGSSDVRLLLDTHTDLVADRGFRAARIREN